MSQYFKILLTFFFLGITCIPSNAIIQPHTEKTQPQTHTLKQANKGKLIRDLIEKRFKKEDSKRKRILTTAFLVFVGLSAIYLLQGTLWLSLLSIGGLIVLFRKKLFKPSKEYEERVFVNKDGEEIRTTVSKGRNTRANSSKSIRYFFGWLGSSVAALLMLILSIALDVESALSIIPLLFFGMGLLSLVLMVLSFVYAVKSVKAREKNNTGAIVVLVIGGLFLLSALSPIFALLFAA